MSETLSTFMKIALTIVVLSTLIMGLTYKALKTTNNDYHQKLNHFQIKEK